jgi:hypothetical protein
MMNAVDEAQTIYAALFGDRPCPENLPSRYEAAVWDLALPPVPSVDSAAWSSLELALRSAGALHPLALRMRLVAYLAETSVGHYSTLHAPKPRAPLAVILDIASCFFLAKLMRLRGQRLRSLYGL